MKDSLLKNIKNSVENLKLFTATPGYGVTRLPFTKESKEASEYLLSEM